MHPARAIASASPCRICNEAARSLNACCESGGMADALDLGSSGVPVGVRVPPLAWASQANAVSGASPNLLESRLSVWLGSEKALRTV